MSTKIKIVLVAAAAAAVVFFLVWRRRAQAAGALDKYGTTPPTNQTAVTQLQTGVRNLAYGAVDKATQAAGNVVAQILPPVIGQGMQAVIPQSTPRPSDNPCPDPDYVGPSPVSATTWCGGRSNCPPEGGGLACSLLRSLKKISTGG